jgi:NTP pyrophosphatase (non-canonical NTP hydrolase)
VYATKLALIHSEVSEALEALRSNDVNAIPNMTEELADAIIRICDLAGEMGLPLSYTILQKTKKNIERPYKHGKGF